MNKPLRDIPIGEVFFGRPTHFMNEACTMRSADTGYGCYVRFIDGVVLLGCLGGNWKNIDGYIVEDYAPVPIDGLTQLAKQREKNLALELELKKHHHRHAA